MKAKVFIFYLLAVLLGGCVLSLHPLYTDKELIFDEKLLGSWDLDEHKWEFKKAGEKKSYELIVTDEGGKGEFAAHLVKIDKMLFLDLYPKGPDFKASNYLKLHLLPAHTFLRIEQIEPTLKIRAMNPEKMDDMLEKDPNLVKHEVVEGRIVLTASPKELQKFMKKYADVKDLFGEPGELKRPELEDPNKPKAIDPNKP